MVALVPRDSYIGLIIGPTVWTAYFVLVYLIAGLGCELGYGTATLAGMNAIQLVLLAAAAVSALVILAAGVQANQGWREMRHPGRRVGPPDARARNRFIYLCAITLCGLSFVGTIWVAIAAVASPIC